MRFVTKVHDRCCRVSYEKLSAEGTILLPLIHASCEYDIDGRVLVVPLKGKGIFKGNISELTVTILMLVRNGDRSLM